MLVLRARRRSRAMASISGLDINADRPFHLRRQQFQHPARTRSGIQEIVDRLLGNERAE